MDKPEITYKIECDKGHDYTHTTDRQPLVCGACGCRDIRVWTLTYDAMTLAIKARILARRGDMFLPNATAAL